MSVFCVSTAGAVEAYRPCVDYYSVGPSKCAPKEVPAVIPAAVADVVVPNTDPVRQFMDDHDKPPVEFAEFYLNPTPENARKWVQAFSERQQRSQAVNEAWRVAEDELRAAGQLPARVTPTAQTSAPQAPRPTAQRLGGLTDSPVSRTAESRPQLVYYFSATCPFCKQLEPDLLAFSQAQAGKFAFTCVDLTPLSPTHAPKPENKGGLPCNWRPASQGEVEAMAVRATPTLFATPGGSKTSERLSGVVSMQRVAEALGLR